MRVYLGSILPFCGVVVAALSGTAALAQTICPGNAPATVGAATVRERFGSHCIPYCSAAPQPLNIVANFAPFGGGEQFVAGSHSPRGLADGEEDPEKSDGEWPARIPPPCGGGCIEPAGINQRSMA
jgi:hypothetical protein